MNRNLLLACSSLIIVGIFAFAGCGKESGGSADITETQPGYSEEFNAFTDAIDVDYAENVMTRISSFGNDEVYGMRGAGSPAEKATCDYITKEMKRIGLQNVTVDESTVDGWTFNGASITYRNARGAAAKADLAAYQTTIRADNQEYDLVYAGKGTAEDYEGLDVNGKLVLITIDNDNDWWINYPAYQAKVKGTVGVIAIRKLADMGEGTETRVGVQDICGPADAPALAISNKDFKSIRKAMKAKSRNTIKVKLTADSVVTKGAKSHNVYGEIPGKTQETIFVFAHMDGYFHSFYDDAQGVGIELAQAKALLESCYKPERTIRFCVHGAEEWGRAGSEYDWSLGAYNDIAVNHPDWVNGAIAIVNNDSGYCVEDEPVNGVMSSIELRDFAKSVFSDFESEFPSWEYEKLTTGTEDFYWTRVGIPAISAGSRETTHYDDVGYHTNFDNSKALPLDKDMLQSTIKVYGKAILDLDFRYLRPMDFTARIKSFKRSLTPEARTTYKNEIDRAYAAAEKIDEKITTVEKSQDREAAVELNINTQEIYIAIQDALQGIDLMNVEQMYRSDMYEYNVECLDGAIEALKNRDVADCVDNWLCDVDWAWYDMNFDEETTDYMENQLFANRDGTFGEGLIQFPHADTFAVSQSLWNKYDQKNPKVSEEIRILKELRATQENYLAEIYASEMEGLAKATALMNKYAN